jgi:hypothetical protein
MNFPSSTPNCECDRCEQTRYFLSLILDMDEDDQEFMGMIYTRACALEDMIESQAESRPVQRPRWLRGEWR